MALRRTAAAAMRRCVLPRAATCGAPAAAFPAALCYCGRTAAPLLAAARRSAASTAGEEDDDFEFDVAGNIQAEHAQQQQNDAVRATAAAMVPPGASQAALFKLQEVLRQFPINACIVTAEVVIPHVANDAGEDVKMRLGPMPRGEALQNAADAGMDLVQLAVNSGVAYCRVRHEQPKALKKIADLLVGLEGGAAPAAEENAVRMKALNVHTFRDVVDAHFIEWRSKKVAAELAKRHPIKLQIEKFATAHAAVEKMQEMLEAVKEAAEEYEPVVVHHHTGISVSEKDLSVTLTPSVNAGAANAAKQIKHPGEKEWAQALRKLEGNFDDGGRTGTYKKHGQPKRVNVGARTFRADKYGRKL
jgi:translation initiation factor IF-3